MKRFLVIRLSAIGDVVLATAALEALSQAHPKAEVHFLVKSRFAGLLAGHPGIARLWEFDERGRHRGVRGMLLFLHSMQRERFDAIIDLQDNLRSRLIGSGLRAGRRLRWDKQALRRRLLVRGRLRAKPFRNVVDRYLDTLAPLGIEAADARPKLYPDMTANIPGLPNKPFLCLAPGAHWATKRWPAESYRELADLIIKQSKQSIVLVGGEADAGACRKVAAASEGRIANLCGRLDLGQLAAVLARSVLLVTNDSGPMHMAEAVGVPIVALFGPTVPQFGFAPWRQGSVVMERELGCRPCSVHGSDRCPRRHQRCLRDITPQEAWGKVRERLYGK
jgi:heptosyltransferase-2